MTEDALHDRGKAMEDVFFRRQDQKLLDKMKSELAANEDRSALIGATGIEDEEVINHLMQQGISVATLAGVGLIPLIAVAWADGKVDKEESDAILKAARESGISEDHSSYSLISGWLNKKPGDELLDSWKEYVGAMKKTLDPTSLAQVKSSVIDRARLVADSAGGFLGIHKTSAVEQKVIDELTRAFE